LKKEGLGEKGKGHKIMRDTSEGGKGWFLRNKMKVPACQIKERKEG